MNVNQRQKHLLSADSKSLWNFTSAPGWNQEEIDILKKAIKKFGMGSWKKIDAARCLPGKTAAQLNLQAQRLCGQQSLGDFFGIHMDVVKLREVNDEIMRNNPEIKRKNGCIVNQESAPTPEQRRENIRKNTEKYGLSQEEIDEIVIEAKQVDTKQKLASQVERQRNRKIYRALKELLAFTQERLAIIALNEGTHPSQLVEQQELVVPVPLSPADHVPFAEHQEFIKKSLEESKKKAKELATQKVSSKNSSIATALATTAVKSEKTPKKSTRAKASKKKIEADSEDSPFEHDSTIKSESDMSDSYSSHSCDSESDWNVKKRKRAAPSKSKRTTTKKTKKV